MSHISGARFAAVFLLTLATAGCAKQAASSNDAAETPSPSAIPSVTALPSAAAASPSAAAASPAVAAASPAAGGRISDVAGVNGEKQIVELAALGAIDPANGAFDPGAAVKRRDFVRWLVKADNALWRDQPAKQVRLGDSTDKSAFSDVAASDPDFPYIQGLQDAGYSVGFPDGKFRPDDALTREQMFAIKNTFDRGGIDAGLAKDLNYARNTAMPQWKDKQAISKTYVVAIATGANGGADSFARVYGTSSVFRPQQTVTRAQAAVAVSVIGDHTFYGGGVRSADAPPAASTTPPT